MKERGMIQEVDSDYTEIITNATRLDLGCGERKIEGYTGVDISPITGVDIVYDLTKYPWPWEDNSILDIRCSHFLEHVVDIKTFMEECYRILTPGGIIQFTCPYYSSIRAWQDFTHVRSINENTFLYFSQDFLKINLLNHYNVKCNFSIKAIRYIYGPEWEGRAVDAREWARIHYNNVVLDIIVDMQTIK
jgi:SAM-dependent methyltransferase